MEAINLLPNKSRLQLKQARMVARLKLAAVALLAAFCLVTVAVVSGELLLKREIQKNQQQLRAARAEFSQFLGKLDELQNLRFRVKLVAKTLQQRLLVTKQVEALE